MTRCWVCKKDPMDEMCYRANRWGAAVTLGAGIVGILVYLAWRLWFA